MCIDLSIMNCRTPSGAQLIEGETTPTSNGGDISKLNHFNRTTGGQRIIGEQVVAVVLILDPPCFQLRELIQYSRDLSLHFQWRNRNSYTFKTFLRKIKSSNTTCTTTNLATHFGRSEQALSIS